MMSYSSISAILCLSIAWNVNILLFMWGHSTQTISQSLHQKSHTKWQITEMLTTPKIILYTWISAIWAALSVQAPRNITAFFGTLWAWNTFCTEIWKFFTEVMVWTCTLIHVCCLKNGQNLWMMAMLHWWHKKQNMFSAFWCNPWSNFLYCMISHCHFLLIFWVSCKLV